MEHTALVAVPDPPGTPAWDNGRVTALPLSLLVSLAAVLLVSGTAKLVSPGASLQLVAGLPLPRFLRGRWLREVLPWVEIFVALALVLTAGALLWLASAAALTLFVLFTAAVVPESRRPDPAPCGCFGALSRAPVSARTVVRNTAFTMVAALALLAVTVTEPRGPVVPLPWGTRLALLVPVLLLLLCLWAERDGRDRSAPDVSQLPPLPPRRGYDDAETTSLRTAPLTATGHGAGPEEAAAAGNGVVGTDSTDSTDNEADLEADYERAPIPHTVLRNRESGSVTLRALAAIEARALFFVNPTCGECVPVIERLATLGDHLGPVALHTVVSREESLDLLPAPLRAAGLVDADPSAAVVFEQTATIWAVVLGADGLLAGGPVVGGGVVLELLQELQDRFTA